ncbi:MAG: DUF429 domain-containing protein [Gammaproteobacteria bacterium]|nr:DUF429 domain-containing protein [Gammaproteobacteria bacterium]
MRVFGLDFTSAPRRGKPITCAACALADGTLRVEALVALESFEIFENFLGTPGPWLAGMDFPFGQPRRLCRGLGWPERWADLARHMGGLEITEFEHLLADYRAGRAPGDKHHLRATDRLASSRSPMMLYGVPVARMFYRGVPLLERAEVSVLPCRPLDTDRVVVEVYPALVARRYIGKRSYKNDARVKQTPEREAARRDLIAGITSGAVAADYGFELDLPDGLTEEFARDGSADRLDALLCAIQAAWAWTRRDESYGIPRDADPLEGWIVDPEMLIAEAEVAAAARR